MSERILEVELAKDGRIVLTSLGGGMPVGIRMTPDEAQDVIDGLYTVLVQVRVRQADEKLKNQTGI